MAACLKNLCKPLYLNIVFSISNIPTAHPQFIIGLTYNNFFLPCLKAILAGIAIHFADHTLTHTQSLVQVH